MAQANDYTPEELSWFRRPLKLAALLLAMAGCATDPEPLQPADCGPRPIRPVVTPLFTKTEAIMTHAEYAALIQYAKDAEVWGICIEDALAPRK